MVDRARAWPAFQAWNISFVATTPGAAVFRSGVVYQLGIEPEACTKHDVFNVRLMGDRKSRLCWKTDKKTLGCWNLGSVVLFSCWLADCLEGFEHMKGSNQLGTIRAQLPSWQSFVSPFENLMPLTKADMLFRSTRAFFINPRCFKRRKPSAFHPGWVETVFLSFSLVNWTCPAPAPSNRGNGCSGREASPANALTTEPTWLGFF